MDLKVLKWHVLGKPLVRFVVIRTFVFVLALIAISKVQMAYEVQMIKPMMSSVDKCSSSFGLKSGLKFTGLVKPELRSLFSLFEDPTVYSDKNRKMAKNVFKELMEKNMLHLSARTLCVGEGSASSVLALKELGFANAVSANRHPFFSLLRRKFVYKLNFEDNHFDFVFSKDLDKVSVPALLVLEIERVLRPGGTGAMLVGAQSFNSGGLVRLATPVSSFLKSSDIVHVCSVESESFTLVIFKKRIENFASFQHFQLPDKCPSVTNNKPYMKYIEPLADEKLGHFYLEPSYLPNFMNISSRNKLIYINVGAGELAKTSVEKMSKSYISNHHEAFEVFVVDHKTYVLSSYVTDPGITFVYHPALDGDANVPVMSSDQYSSTEIEEEAFDFVNWFNEIVTGDDFIVLMMNAKPVELNILVELFKTGAICHVDELFLRCSDASDCKTAMPGDCVSLFEGLRKSGVYVHKWLGD